ncbi:unnamed protein product [Tilletia controversa]|nr:unnamed protein product [Tilletia controversa]
MDVLASDSSTQTQRRSSPMSDIVRGRHVYVNEVVALDERYFLVELFFVDEDNHIWACGRKAQYQAPSLIIGATATIQIQTSTIKHTGLELSRMLIMSNYDVSGASSKRWNKHHVCLVQNATMKPSMLCEEGSLKIFAVSNTATPQEICQALVASFENLSLNGVLCWDVQRNEEVFVLVTLAAMICDNPMAAELASNIGSNGAYSCRTCMFGGNKAFKQSDAGVAAATKPGVEPTVKGIKETLLDQLALSINGTKGAWSAKASATGVKDKLTTLACKTLRQELELRLENGDEMSEDVATDMQDMVATITREGHHWNPLLNLSVIQSLHGNSKQEVRHWLRAASMAGIGDARHLDGSYLVKHHRSLVGKDLKRLTQVMPWVLHSMKLPLTWLNAWHSHGRLAAALYSVEWDREHQTEWLEYTRFCLKNFYSHLATMLPALLPKKTKLHTLTHCVRDMQHFGPLFTVASERFESFNAVVRQASIMSNRKRPSRDITRRIAVQETIRDALAEAVYFDPERQTWQKTGLGCSRLLVGSEAGKEAILTMYGLKSQKTTVGESVSANDVVLMVACKELTDKDGSLKMSTRIAKVYECNESTKTLSLLPVWPRPRPSNPLLEATVGSLDELFVAPLSDLLGVLNANHNCRSQGCRPYEDTVRHRGSDLDIVVNDCLFRSAYVAKLDYQLWNPGSV